MVSTHTGVGELWQLFAAPRQALLVTETGVLFLLQEERTGGSNNVVA